MRTIYRSTVFDAPVDAVWAIIRDFNDWPSWLKIIAGSEIEGGGPSDAVGAVRALVVPPSDTARERLEGLDDHAHTITYSVLETSSPPINDYVATIRLTPVTDGDRTFAEWSGSFWSPDPEAEPAIADAIAAMVYEGGFAGVRERLGVTV
jgi:hypothetical protein